MSDLGEKAITIESPEPDYQEMELILHITDRDLCSELEQHSEGRDRHDYAVGAMRIGVLALRQAQGRVDAERIRTEGDRLLENLGLTLAEHRRTLGTELTTSLKEYFDPESGRFNERVERLIRRDGELEQLLRQKLSGNDSELAHTLANHVGEESPLMKFLDPQTSEGLIATLAKSIEETLSEQSQQILNEFSLDNKEGALSRLVEELSHHHGEVSEALEKRIGEVVAEFSLDHEDSALSRLVRRVEQAQKQISSEFSLDEEDSALARMRRELLEVIDGQRKANDQFQREVMEKLTEMVARKEEAARSTRHGEVFEEAVFSWIQSSAQKAGDIATRTGSTTGLIKNCKKGDIAIELGPEHTARGTRIVVEAREKASTDLKDALTELEEARKNRDAQVGLFVFSSLTAPPGLEPLARYGDDIVVIWDAEDPRTDVVLLAGLSISKALCAKNQSRRQTETADFEAIDRAILEIEKQAGGLDEITRSAETIKNGSGKILDRARIMREAFAKQIGQLSEKVGELRTIMGAESESSLDDL